MDAAIADRVRAVIAHLGMSDKSFAKAVGMPVDQLSKSLNGKRKFSAYELAVIAETGGVTVDWLSTGAQRHRLGLAARTIGLELVDYDAEAKVLAERIVDAVDVLVELGRRRPIPPLPELQSSGGFVDEGRRAAAWALNQLGDYRSIVVGPTNELVSAIETAFGVDVANSAELPVGFDGVAFQDETVRLILLLTTELWTRRRFTLAHELGHILWGDAHEVIAESIQTGFGADYKEKRANAFAGAFLMPQPLLDELIDGRGVADGVFHELVVTLKVSPSALAVRLKSLNLIDDSRFRALRQYRTSESIAAAALPGVANAEIREIAAAQTPNAPGQIVAEFLTAYREGLVSSAHLSSLTGLPQSSWREMLNDSLTDETLAAASADSAAADAEEVFAP